MLESPVANDKPWWPRAYDYNFHIWVCLHCLLISFQVVEKPKVEDGIFGTSGGIGFTKQNELFVGRVAMIGFAVS